MDGGREGGREGGRIDAGGTRACRRCTFLAHCCCQIVYIHERVFPFAQRCHVVRMGVSFPRRILSLLATVAAVALTTVHGVSRVAFLADTHIGEGCNSSYSGYQLNDTNCYSVRDLKRTVEKINAVHAKTPIAFAILGGDVTSSAQATEYVAAKRELDLLAMDYIPLMGNHDVWSYNEVLGDLTSTPIADRMFASTFAPIFHKWRGRGLTYENQTVPNPLHKCNSTFQSWALDVGKLSTASDDDRWLDLQNVYFVSPDFNTRLKAPPPCPGHSPIGGCGVPGMAELFNFTNGTIEWFHSQLTSTRTMRPTIASVIMAIHQPFRCRQGVPDWAFCFSKKDKDAIRAILRASPLPLHSFWGVLAGHQHRWFNGTAFDEAEFHQFRQWENSAVKGDVFDSEMASSFSVLTFEDSRVTMMEKFWTERGVWKSKQGH